jgi:hypothetical protein
MTSVWFDLPPGEVLPQHRWYKHLGLGHSIRTAGLPLRLTKAMAHQFTQAPHHYTAIAAVRWAQVRDLGGCEALARAVPGLRGVGDRRPSAAGLHAGAGDVRPLHP